MKTIVINPPAAATPYGWKVLGALIRASRLSVADPDTPHKKLSIAALSEILGIRPERLRYIEMSRKASPSAPERDNGGYATRFDDLRRIAAIGFVINLDSGLPYSLDEIGMIATEQHRPKNPLTGREFTVRDFEELDLKTPDSLLSDRAQIVIAPDRDEKLERLRELFKSWLKRCGVSRSQLKKEIEDVISRLQAQEEVEASHLVSVLYGEAIPNEDDIRFLIMFPMFRPGTPIAFCNEQGVLCGIEELILLLPQETPSKSSSATTLLKR